MAEGQGPLPRRVIALLVGMVAVALLCLALALILADVGRVPVGEAREGYAHVLHKGGVRAKVVSGTDEMTGEARVAVPTDAIPMDLPVSDMGMPTEVPPVSASVVVPLPVGNVSGLSVSPMPQAPRWQANAVAVEVPAGAPKLALLIDDMGGQMAESRRAVRDLPVGVTLSFFPWSREGVALAREARGTGHEIMIHMPMEALSHGDVVPQPGPDTLKVGMAPDEIAGLLEKNVAVLADVAVGVNNHMGSRFTEWEPGMRAVLTVLQREGMLFVDSKTAAPTAVKAASAGLELPVLVRDVFLDHEPSAAAVRQELGRAVALARKKGFALAIGHPLPVTLDVLAAELPAIVSSGVVLVPVTAGIGL